MVDNTSELVIRELLIEIKNLRQAVDEMFEPEACPQTTPESVDPEPKKSTDSLTLTEEIEQVNRLFGPKCKTCGADLPDGGVTGFCEDHNPASILKDSLDRLAELREKYNRDFVVMPTATGLARRLDGAAADINELLDEIERLKNIKETEDGESEI